LFSSSAASVMMMHNWCTLLGMPLFPLVKSLDLSHGLSIAASAMNFRPVLSGSSNFSCRFSVAVRLTGEFASLEEPTDDQIWQLFWFYLSTDPISLDLKDKLNPKAQYKSSNFGMSTPSFCFRRLLDRYWLKAKKPLNS
jgi:hypothetical protein